MHPDHEGVPVPEATVADLDRITVDRVPDLAHDRIIPEADPALGVTLAIDADCTTEEEEVSEAGTMIAELITNPDSKILKITEVTIEVVEVVIAITVTLIATTGTTAAAVVDTSTTIIEGAGHAVGSVVGITSGTTVIAATTEVEVAIYQEIALSAEKMKTP